MPHNISREARVGVVAALAIFCFAFLMVFLRAVKISTKGHLYYVVFDDAGHVIPGTDVNIAGVRVGEVHAVKLNPATNMAQVELIVDSKYTLYQNYKFRIAKAALIGQSAIEIVPTTESPGPVLKPENEDTPVVGYSPASIESVIPEINDTLRTIRDTTSKMQKIISDPTIVDSLRSTALDVSKTAEGMRKFITDPAMAARVRNSLENVERTTQRAVAVADSMTKLAADLRSVIGENRSEVKLSFAQLSEAAKNLEQATAKLKVTANELNVKDRFDEAAKTFQQTLAHFEATAKRFRDVANDPQFIDDTRAMIAQAKDSTANLKSATEELKTFLADADLRADLKAAVKEGKDTAAAAKEVVQATKTTVTTANDALANLKVASEDLTYTMKSARSAADRVDKFLNRSNPLKSTTEGIKPDLTFRHLGDRGVTVTDLNLRVGGGKTFFRTGLSDIGGGGVRFSLQQGFGFGGSTAARFGVFRSHAGVGVDKSFGATRLSLDAYDPSRLKYSAWFSLPMTRKTDLVLGGERDRSGTDRLGAGLSIKAF